MRTQSLGEAFEERGIRPIFLVHVREEKDGVLENAFNRCIRKIDWHRDRETLLEAIEGSDIAIVDSYLADRAGYRAIAAASKLTVYLDDDNRLDYPDGVVLNGAMGAEGIAYPKNKGKHYLLGPTYLALRKAFWRVPQKQIDKEIRRVLITFGGSDPRNMTPRILKLLCDRYPAWFKRVVIGKSFEHVDEIIALNLHPVERIFYPDDEGMKALMLVSDLVISAGGQTVYECARVGVPLIAVAVSENQRANVIEGQKAGFLESAGTWNERDFSDKMIAKIERLREQTIREKMQDIGKRTIDGRGSKKTVNALLKRYVQNHGVLRTARIEDSIQVYALSNDPEVRAFSFRHESISLEDHLTWYADKLKDRRCHFYVAEAGGLFLGQTRFDLEGRDAAVGICMEKKWRGLGLGKFMLQEAIARLNEAAPEVLAVKAYIKEENTLSIHFFESLGFEYLSDALIENQDAKVFLYPIRCA